MKKQLLLPSSLTNKVQFVLNEIADYLDKINPNSLSSSLFNGNMGVALFFSYYSKYTLNKYYENRYIEFLEASLGNIDEKMNGTLCRGLAGVFWGFKHLIPDSIINNENEYYLSLFRNYICKDIIYHASVGNYDYLHGSIGSATILLNEINVKEVEFCLSKLIYSLDKSAKCGNEGIFWECINGRKINISLSHGLSSICIFLAKAYQQNICRIVTKELLQKSVKYLLSQEFHSLNRTSMFPSFSLEDKIYKASRLGWCYGDLGIALALWYYSDVMDDNNIRQKVIEILNHSSSRKDSLKSGVKEPGICHGAAGVSLIFKKMYDFTGNERFAESAIYWLSQTLNMASHKNGIAGFSYESDVNPIDLLTGITGVGLVLLSFLEPKYTNWDECFLLS